MGDKIVIILVEKGYCVWVYCFYGDFLLGMVYLICCFLENIVNSLFFK